MLINHDKITKICTEYGIDIYQYWVLSLRLTEDWKNLDTYRNVFPIKFDKILDLEVKGYIEPINDFIKQGHDDLDMFDITPTGKVADSLFVEMDIAGNQLYTVYPKYITINGQSIVATKGETINGKYYDKDLLIETYSKKIGLNKELHNKVIEAVRIGKEKGCINFVLRSFILDELWENLFEILKDHIDKNYSATKVI